MEFYRFFCFHLFVCCHSALYDRDLYFDSSDERRAECIVASEIHSYTYLGDRSVTVKGERCLPWREVYDINIRNLANNPEAMRKYMDKAAPDEVMLHNKCRRFDLYPEHPWKGALKLRGPWCYIRKNKQISYDTCFEDCKGQPREEKEETGKSQYGEKQLLKNYNDVLIENIQKFYRSYSWGDLSYYRWKPSDDSFSAEYYRMREQIFYGCVITVIVLILWLLMCSYLRKEAAAARRRREQALKMIFPNRKIQMNPVVRPHVS